MKALRGSLAAKLLAAQLLVVVAGALTLAFVALAVAPGLFHGHVRDALGLVPQDVSHHLDEAFQDSVLLSLAVAVAAALAAAALRALLAWLERMPDAGLDDADPRRAWWFERPAAEARRVLAAEPAAAS